MSKFSWNQWTLVNQFNIQTGILPDNCQYVVLLNNTQNFQVIKDLKFFLKINKKPLSWFIKEFRNHRVRVEYTTLFTVREKKKLGPIATKICNGITTRLFQKIYNHKTTKLVSSTWNIKKMWGEKCQYASIHPETFRDQITSQVSHS